MLDKSEKRPFEERAIVFKNLVRAISLSLGGDEEYNLRQLGGLIVEYHGLETDEKRDKFKEEKISPIYDKLEEAGKRNWRVGEAVVNVIFAESMLD